MTMHKRYILAAAVAAAGYAGYALAQYPILDRIAEKVIAKYQNASCEQLWQAKGQPHTEEEQRVVALLKTDANMRTHFLNKVAAPIANKMFACGMIP
jgi:mRNA degradation ribonuclease J1/J2